MSSQQEINLPAIIEALPDGLLDVTATDLHTILPTPTLIHLRGRQQPAVFVSVLQHGNEPTGLLAIQQLLRDYQDRELPRSLSIFIGNVAAARYEQRRLDNQPDYNRIWTPGPTPEHAMMQRVIEEMCRRGVFASIDVHNNTGANPHYACINQLDHRFLQLATLFSRVVVFFTTPDSVQSNAFGKFCPAVTLECGMPAQPYGVNHAREFIEACLHLTALPEHPVASHDIDLFHTVATVKIPDDVSFGFGQGAAADLRFPDDVDHLNFCELPARTLLGWANIDSNVTLDVRNEKGKKIDGDYFSYDDGEIRTRMPVMPSMLTRDAQVIRQDCLCYLMERMVLPQQ